MELIKKIKESIRTSHLFKNGSTVIVGVSGGPDSVFLLHVLYTLRYELGIYIYIAHLNHRLRKSADLDQQFVERVARELKVPCTVSRRIIQKSTKVSSLEERARQVRFDFLTQVAQKQQADIIVLGHTQDDLAETVLMRILRGTGLLGMRAILPKKEINGFTVVRPLLTVKRKEILSYITANNIKYRNDPTNRNTKFFRNKIRLQLLPLLEREYNGNVKEILANLSFNITIDYNYLELQGQQMFDQLAKISRGHNQICFSLPIFKKLHPSLQRMTLRLAIERLNGSIRRVTFLHIKEIEDLLKNRRVGAIVNLPNRITVTKTRSLLQIGINQGIKAA